MGLYLKLHLTKGINGKVRRAVLLGHGIVGKAMPVASWVQMLFGGIAALGYCRDDHLGQCLAHFIMGSAFIGYGIIMMIMLLVGQAWLRGTGRSQEFFDSAVIAAWGCVNTFTEHRWGGAWVENDIQHTVMGVIWWAAGLAGIWLSRGRDGSPKRNFVPGFVLFLTGWGMSGHPQHSMISTMVHTAFGYSLMAAGLTRIVEVAFVLHDKPCLDSGEPSSFQYIPPFVSSPPTSSPPPPHLYQTEPNEKPQLLIASGFTFMSATEEQMALLSGAGITHVAYILVLYSFAFLLFLLVNVLLHIYAVNAGPTVPPKDVEGVLRRHRTTDSRQIHEAEEFELDGLISDDEDARERGSGGLESPSTLGKNSEVRVA